MLVERQREALDQLREVARRRAGAAAVAFACVLAAGGTASVALPPLYRAAAVLAVEPGRSDPELPGELTARLDTISQRVISRTPLLNQARRFNLYPELATRGLSDAVFEQMTSDIRLESKSTADPGGRGNLVGLSLSYRGRDPATAARVSNDLASLYLEQDALLRSQRYAGRAELLKHRLTEMKQRLDEHGEASPDLRRQPAEREGARGATDVAALDHLTSQLRALRDERLRALERRDGLLKQLSEADPHTSASARIETLRRQLIQKRQTLTSKHPDVLQLEAEIAALDQESRALQGTAPAEGTATQRLHAALEETDAALRGMKSDEERLTLELAAVQEGRRAAPMRPAAAPRDFPAVQEVYGSLLRRYEDAQIADSAEAALAPRLKLLDPATAPLRESGPPRGRLVFFTLLAACAAAITTGALAERLDRSFRSLDDLRAFTQVPVLVTIPTLLTRGDRWRRRGRLAFACCGVALGVALVALCSYHVFAQGYWLTAALERAR